jgi:hypothetical protein
LLTLKTKKKNKKETRDRRLAHRATAHSSNALLAEPIGVIELPSNSVGNRYRFFVNDVAFKAMGSSPDTNVRINPTLLRLQPGGAMRNFDSITLSLPYRR